MRNFNIVKLAAALTLALAIVPAAMAQSAGVADGPAAPPAGRHWGGGPRGGEFFLKQLGLSDEQKAQISQIKSNHQNNIKTLETTLRTGHQALFQMEQGTAFDEGAATQKLTEMASTEAALMGERFRMNQEIQAVLTPAQKAQLQTLKAQFQQKMQQRMQMMRSRHNQGTTTTSDN